MKLQANFLNHCLTFQEHTMREILVTIFFSIGMLTTFGQQGVPTVRPQNENVSVQNNNATIYRLFPTEHMKIFIKLNTRTGQMWLVQYDIEGSSRLETFLSLTPLVEKEDEANRRFTLYPTKNIYTFILLDQLDGRTWQVQWATEAEKRMLLRIN